MAVAGTLAVNVISQTSKFVQGMSKARKGLGGFVKSVATGQAVTSKFNTLLGAVSAGGMVRMGLSAINTAAELGNVADKLGIATENLELMRFAAEQTGVSTSTLDMALQRMVRRVGQAAQGAGEAAGTLEQLGLNAGQLNKLDPAAQFERISAAVRNIPDRGGQLAAMQKIFDSEGVGLINLAADGVERYADAFERAGGATQGVKTAQEFALALNELSGQMQAIARDIATDLLPVLMDAIKGSQIVLENMGIIRSGGQRASQDPYKRASRLQRAYTGAGEQAAAFIGAFTGAPATGVLVPGGRTVSTQLTSPAVIQEMTNIQREQLQIMREEQQRGQQPGVTLQPAEFQ